MDQRFCNSDIRTAIVKRHFADEPKLPISSADGSFVNACCDTLLLKNGYILMSPDQTIRYSVEQDKVGPYVIPTWFVGVLDGNQVYVDCVKSPINLRLDNPNNPARIELTDLHITYSFVRQLDSPRKKNVFQPTNAAPVDDPKPSCRH